MRRYLNKRASKSPMGRDSEMSNINTKLKSLNKEVQGLYTTNLEQQKLLVGESASVHDGKSDMVCKSPMARSNIDGRSNFDGKSNIRASEVDRKAEEIAESLQNSIYNDDELSVQSGYGQRHLISKPVNGSVTPAGGNPTFDTIPSVKPLIAPGNARSSQ
mmetsp:Transcript_23867/g.27830  ORF Transcript_23867/g.27830 Transcript_23867/m.27830 type:complete len:160 (+) Transcript_23867:1532-2011(+)